jgi:NADH dehydrogenase
MTSGPGSAALPHVVIVGGGFGGLAAAKEMAGAAVRVTLVDRCNHHLFQPLLYQVATAGLAAPAIAAPIRHVLRRQRNCTVLVGEVRGFDLVARQVLFEADADGRSAPPLAWDRLIVASGATHSYFGHDDWAEHAPGLKTLDDAYRIRSRILRAFEQAERCAALGTEADRAEAAEWLRFCVIGGGPTGVEMAGTLAEIARHTLPGEFRHIDVRSAQVLLLEGGAQVLASYPAPLPERARQQLERLGVQVRLGAQVMAIDERGVSLGSGAGGERIPARTVVWAAGVRATPLGRALAEAAGVAPDRAGRVPVQADLSLPGHPHVSVVGDLASVAVAGRAVPGIAPAAKQMGRHAARNLLASLAGRPVAPFVYRDYGSMATIGRHAAIAQFGPLKVSGLPAWWLWLLAHIWFLIGFRNRLVVMLDWAVQYWTQERHARIYLAGDR